MRRQLARANTLRGEIAAALAGFLGASLLLIVSQAGMLPA